MIHSGVPQCSCKQILATRAGEAVQGQWVTDAMGDLQLKPQIQAVIKKHQKNPKFRRTSKSYHTLKVFLI